VVVRDLDVPADVRQNMDLWVGCLAGALEERRYREKLSRAGFEHVDVEPTRIYDEHFMSAFVRAQKPAAATKACCGPACCA